MLCIYLVVGVFIIYLKYSICILKLLICYIVVMYGVFNVCSLKIICI